MEQRSQPEVIESGQKTQGSRLRGEGGQAQLDKQQLVLFKEWSQRKQGEGVSVKRTPDRSFPQLQVPHTVTQSPYSSPGQREWLSALCNRVWR
ncbi:hypothetical protein WMY93_030715 [Mugilogobius chulae]|uniref:Uncharacterized protein n=1 Tax=Mugilogobius chulae TaxID=88201 RepID=A0AAW0MQI5_9GOBI